MVHLTNVLSLLTVGSLMGAAVAHPGEAHIPIDLVKRQEFRQSSRRSLDNCASKLKARGIEQRAIARRHALADSLRKRDLSKPGYLKARDLNSTLETDHHSNLTGLTADSDSSLLFTGNVSCILQPETTQGPYYVDGELIRSDIVEEQEGVPLYADVQFIDVNTCEAVPDIYIDWWHCNSTGVYSGIVASGNGDSSDATNINKTFLRGLQTTDEDGVVQFQTLFPGHYTSRANHVHILAHLDAEVLPNNTLTGGKISHVGQLFFDQDLISEVEVVAPYSSNTQELTLNSEDTILSQEAEDMDPVMQYVLLGDDISDGLLAWISVGIDTTANYTVSSAATWTANGGVANSGSGVGGGSGGPPSGVPSGSPPSS